MTVKRCCIFAHFDPDDVVDPYVLEYLHSLRPFVQEIVFVSTSQLDTAEVGKVEALGAKVICRKNDGYDFCSWKLAIAQLKLDEYDELLQVNDSCYAPLFDFSPIFKKMADTPCDFWGMTRSYTFSPHLQSYFVCYRKSVIESKVFRDFWDTVKPIHSKDELVKSYEVGLSRVLIDNHFTMTPYFTLPLVDRLKVLPGNLIRKFSEFPLNLNPYKYLRNLLVYTNPTHYYYREMLNKEVPTLKVSLMRGEKIRMPSTDLRSVAHINQDIVDLILQHQTRTGYGITAQDWIPTRNVGS